LRLQERQDIFLSLIFLFPVLPTEKCGTGN
jgi:hypothetical protein